MQFTEKNNDDQDPLEEKVLRREKLTLKLRSVKERQAKKDTRRATKTDELLAQIDDIQKEVKYRTALRMAEWGSDVPVWIKMTIMSGAGHDSFVWIFLSLSGFNAALVHLFNTTQYLSHYRHFFTVVHENIMKERLKQEMTNPDINILEHDNPSNLVVCLHRHFAMSKDKNALAKLHMRISSIESNDCSPEKLRSMFVEYDSEKY